MRFSNGILLDLQHFLLDLYSAPDIDRLREVIPLGASRLISSDRANFNEIDLSPQRRGVIPSPEPAYWKSLGPFLVTHMHEHPLGELARRPNFHRAYTFSDLNRDRNWRGSALYHDYFVPAGARHQLLVPVFENGPVRYSLAFNRHNKDFSARERALLEIISPHIACALQRLLNSARSDTGAAPASIENQEPLHVTGLTPRENEVLHWICAGKRNAEIATILRLSPRTVGKHLENLLAKLGVETRTAAARVALEQAGTRRRQG